MSKGEKHIKRHARDGWAKKERSLLPVDTKIEEFIALILDWYGTNGRRYFWRNEKATPYQKVIAEILLQRTRADTVALFLPKFYERFPSWKELASSDQNVLREFLYPLGLWRQRAKNLLKLANEMANRDGKFPTDYNEIRDLPSVGQYIANAIVLFSFNEPRPLLDVNMARVLERFFGPRELVDIRDDSYIQNLAHTIVFKSGAYADINFAILDLAALICKKSPLCQQCPVRVGCKLASKTNESH